MTSIFRLISALAFILLIASANAETISVCHEGCNHKSIQEAIDAASDGDMVSVESGIYAGAINLNKRLTLRGVDNGGGMPEIIGDNSTIVISANGSVIDGFVISGASGAGIDVLSRGNTVLRSDLLQNGIGIRMLSGKNIITRNNISENGLGIMVQNASGNTMTFNSISHNRQGVALRGSTYNIIAGNALTNNPIGIGLYESENNSLLGNNINGSVMADAWGFGRNCWQGNIYEVSDANVSNETCGPDDAFLKWPIPGPHSNLSLISPEVSLPPKEAYALMQEKGNLVILDVRTPEEYESGHIEGAVNLDYYSPQFISGLRSLDKNSTYIIYCRRGYRGGVALEMMTALGFRDVHNILGGITQWAGEGLPVTGEVV